MYVENAKKQTAMTEKQCNIPTMFLTQISMGNHISVNIIVNLQVTC